MVKLLSGKTLLVLTAFPAALFSRSVFMPQRTVSNFEDLKSPKQVFIHDREYDQPFLKGYPTDIPFDILATKNVLGPHNSIALKGGGSPWFNIPYERRAYVLKLNNWYVCSESNGTIFNRLETYVPSYNGYLPCWRMKRDEVQGKRVVKIPKAACFVLGCGEGYYHFVAEVLARLTLTIPHIKGDPEIKIMLKGPEQPFMRPYLRMLGFRDHQVLICDDKVFYRVGKLYYPKPSYGGYPSKEDLNRVRRYVLAGANIKSEEKKLVLVIKRLVARRNLKNADEVVARLKEAFPHEADNIVAFTENLSVREQIEMFSRAKVIVGPHGAGFVNMIYTPPGCVNIELVPEKFCSILFWHLAQAMNHTHRHILIPGAGFASQLTIDPQRIIEKIRECGVL